MDLPPNRRRPTSGPRSVAALAFLLLAALVGMTVPAGAAPAEAAPDGPAAVTEGSASTGPSAGISVVKGRKTSIGEWPWQVAVTYNRQRLPGFKPADRQFCGGSLVAPTIVVTAAHCSLQIEAEPRDFSVIAGRTRLNDASAGIEVPVRDVFIPLNRNGFPRYFLQPGWDVAVIELDSPVSQQPIRIVGAGEQDLLRPGTRTVHTGWGATDEFGFDGAASSLMKGSLNIQPARLCSWIGPDFDGSTDLCMGDSKGRTASCFGDSGGPVMANSTNGYRLIGTTSRGIIGVCFGIVPAIDTSLASPAVRDWVTTTVIARSGVDPRGSGAAALPLPRLCTSPRLEGKTLRQARRILRKAGCRKVKLIRNVRRVPAKAKLKPPVVRTDSIFPGWLWDKATAYPLEVTVQKHRTRKRARR